MSSENFQEIHIPYTYLIGWSWLNKWYYGCRYAKNCNPKDLWNPYKTSSEYVKHIINKHGDPDIIQIRRIFKDESSCRHWETKVLRRLKVIKNPKWINLNINIAVDPIFNKERIGKTYKEIYGEQESLEIKEKISKSKQGKVSAKNSLSEIFIVTKEHFVANNELVGINSGINPHYSIESKQRQINASQKVGRKNAESGHLKNIASLGGKAMKGLKWYNDGTVSKRFFLNQQPPKFTLGRLSSKISRMKAETSRIEVNPGDDAPRICHFLPLKYA